LWQVRAKEIVIAAGAIERPLIFPNNDRPGIMLADAARVYAERYGARVGRRALVATTTRSGYRAALALQAAGVEVVAIADPRLAPDGPVVAAARAAGIEVRANVSIIGAAGGARVTGARLVPTDGRGKPAMLSCDVLLMAGGWTPSVHLFSQSRGRLRFDDATNAFVPDPTTSPARSAGACNGVFGVDACLADGLAAGAAAARAAGFAPSAIVRFGPASVQAADPGQLGLMPRASAKHAFVDFQNDVTAKDLALATREGFRSIEHVKRYTTTGMATDQGKTSNLHAMAVVGDLTGRSVPQVGHTTFRMPYTPVTFGSFAGASRGELFDAVRCTPIHPWAEAAGAVFEDVGNWKRAHYFPRAGETMRQAVARECRAVRSAVGIFDASTLGKIEVVGPDAGRFLDRLYTGSFSKLAVGRCRYGLLLNEAGFVMDDGVIARLAPDRFHVTTSTGGAASVLHHMEDYLQTEFTGLRVWLTSVTEQFAVIAVQGARARDVITPLIEGIDLSREALPNVSAREGRVCGVPARLFRVSFTGELGFEINVPADYGRFVWEAVAQAGAACGITPYGTETMHVLRSEKGYIIVGQDTDGTVTPGDLGMEWAIARSKPDFVGKRSLSRPDIIAKGRKQLVGLELVAGGPPLEEGAQIVADPEQPVPMTMIGHVTSSYWSETLGRPIAFALLADGRARTGQTLHVPMPQATIAVRVVDPVFVDPKGERLDA
jgi:sarcosine oxidase subunit alpha